MSLLTQIFSESEDENSSRYLGHNQYWFVDEAAYNAYIARGGYNKAELHGDIVRRNPDGGIIAYISASED